MNQRNANNRDGNGRRNGNDENNEGNFNWWQTGTAAVGAAAVVGGLGALGYCWLTRDSTSAASQSTSQQHGAEQKSFFSTLAETLEAISDESNDRKPGYAFILSNQSIAGQS
ncbi:jg17696 [Pararge aegeria aegeria]|uniref:Jg17696 protein n=1 Tax=Pararge aegeria aegeria TaxID=348720 RepID=A0A8S4QDX7_9NEOP|nr:jg17696 [Pararge aegeria aegeria]